jgi:hypothetical protein
VTAVSFLAGFMVLASWTWWRSSTGYLFGALQLIVRSSAHGDPEITALARLRDLDGRAV